MSVVLLLTGLDAAAFLVPYALVGRATQLGTGTFADAGAITPADVASVAIAAAVFGAVLTFGTAVILDRRDART